MVVIDYETEGGRVFINCKTYFLIRFMFLMSCSILQRAQFKTQQGINMPNETNKMIPSAKCANPCNHNLVCLSMEG
jgi:hypothetical protein